MSINGKSPNDSESIINIGVHVEAIDEDGNWSKAEVTNIIENNLILKFLDRLKDYTRIIDIASNKWHHIENSNTNSKNFIYSDNDFAKGDFVLTKWRDDNYYLSQILDITTKTKFGTKVKEYHILYLYDNVHEIVSQSRLKCPSSTQDQCEMNRPRNNGDETIAMSRPIRKPYKRRSEAYDSHQNDNVFYDEKTKKFTENCKLRRLKLSNKNGDSEECIVPTNVCVNLVDLSNSVDSDNQNPVITYIKTPKSNQNSTPTQRYSQRKRRSPYKKADYFYPDSIDNMLKEKNKYSNNNSQVSTPIPFESNEEILTNSPKLSLQYSCQNNVEIKDCIQSSNHSPISVSLTSTEDSPNFKLKAESCHQILDDKDDFDFQSLYKSCEDGKYQCLICTNKTFRKKQLVFDHIKHYHASDPSENPIEPPILKVPKTVYSPNKRYYSSYLKANRTSIERKKKYNKTKMKSFINRTSFSKYGGRGHKTDYRLGDHVDRLQQTIFQRVTVSSGGSGGGGGGGIVYCQRCKKSTEDGYMVQCDVCLCWSHTACYALNDSNRDSDSFWECDICAGVRTVDGQRSAQWYRDRCRFHSVPRNELPWLTKNATMASPCNIKNICELQSFLSLCQRVLEAITINMDKLTFKNCNDSSGQDDLDILKNICKYDNMDAMNIALTVDDDDDLFHISHASKNPSTSGVHLLDAIAETNKSLSSSSNYHFNEVSFSNSTPNKCLNGALGGSHHSGSGGCQDALNASCDGILNLELQRLEILPKAAFDALVHDLNLNLGEGDLCKDSGSGSGGASGSGSLEHRAAATGSSLQDLLDTCQIGGAANESAEEHSSIIDLTNDDIDCLLLGKADLKSSSEGDGLCTGGPRPPSCPAPPFSQGPASTYLRGGVAGAPAVKENRLAVDMSEWPPSVHAGADGGDRCDAEVDGVQGDAADPRLSPQDGRCLRWLLCKYSCVERIVEAVERAVLDHGGGGGTRDHEEEPGGCSQVARYLHSLLYILKRD